MLQKICENSRRFESIYMRKIQEKFEKKFRKIYDRKYLFISSKIDSDLVTPARLNSVKITTKRRFVTLHKLSHFHEKKINGICSVVSVVWYTPKRNANFPTYKTSHTNYTMTILHTQCIHIYVTCESSVRRPYITVL